MDFEATRPQKLAQRIIRREFIKFYAQPSVLQRHAAHANFLPTDGHFRHFEWPTRRLRRCAQESPALHPRQESQRCKDRAN